MSTDNVLSKKSTSVSSLVIQHPLLVYFVLAYLFAWLSISPAVLGSDGFRLIPVGLHAFPFLTLGAFAGPTLSAWIVTAVTKGKSGLVELLRGYVRWRVGIVWYGVALLGFPILYLVGAAIATGGSALGAAIQQWPLFFTVFLATVVKNGFMVTLWEEPGWRGFALPRLESQYGPMKGTLTLGLLWALWHLPAYFVAGWLGPFNPVVLVVNLIASILLTVVFTWVYNNARESIQMTMILHASSNASSAYLASLPLKMSASGGLIIIGLLVLSSVLVILFTRGRLSYHNDRGR